MFAGKLIIPNFGNLNVERCMGADLSHFQEMNLLALIGRDFLKNVVVVYNGPDGFVSLSI